MRLYLSSYGLGDSSDKLLSMLGNGRRAAVIANAMDPYDDRGVDKEIETLASIGIDAGEVDLRESWDFDGFDVLWVRGGNVFVLREAMARSGADRAIVDLLHRDAIVYAGYSAGPCVLSPTLRGLDLCDDPTEVDGPPIFDGLGILDFVFVPHFDTPAHPETNAMNDVVAYLSREKIAYRTFRDGDVLVIDR